MNKYLTYSIAVALGMLTSAWTTGDHSRGEPYRGYAFVPGTSKHIYTEEHFDHFREGKLVQTTTRYLNPDNELIARRTLDYTASLYAPDFKTEDLRTGYVEGAERMADGKIKLFFRENAEADLEERKMTVPKPCVVDGGFNNFIKDHWEAMSSDSVLRIHFTVSSALDYYTLRIRKVSESETEMKVSIEPDNTLVRWFADATLISYDKASRRITAYVGASNISNQHGNNYVAQLIYPEKGP